MRTAICTALLLLASPALAKEVPSPLLGVPFESGSSAWVVGFGDDAVHRRVRLGYEFARAGGWFSASMALGLSITPRPEAPSASSGALRPLDRLFPQVSLALGWVGDHPDLVSIGPLGLALSPVLRVAGDAAPPVDSEVLPYRLRAAGGLILEARTKDLRLGVGALYDRDLTHLLNEAIPGTETLRLGVSAAYAVDEEVLVTEMEGEQRKLVPKTMSTLVRLSLTWDRPLDEVMSEREGLLLALALVY